MPNNPEPAPYEILVVDDNPANLRLLVDMLKHQGYGVRAAPNGRLALKSVASRPPSLVLLDIRMPDMDGFEVCKRLKDDPASRDIPVVFLSALHEVPEKLRGFEVGGSDYITKPFAPQEILARVRNLLTLHSYTDSLEKTVAERTAHLEIYKQIAAASRDLLAFLDRSYVYRAVNPVYLEAWNKEESDFIGRRVAEILGQELFETQVKPHLDACLAGEVVRYQAWFDFPTHGQRLMDVTYSPFRDEEGRVTGVVVASRDITDLKQARDSLEQAARHWSMAMDSFNDALYLLDTERRLIQGNKVFYDLVGKTPKEAKGQPINALIQQVDGIPCPVRQAMEELRDAACVLEAEDPNNPCPFPTETKVQIVRDDTQASTGILVSIHDLRATREVEAALRESESRYRALFENSPISLWEEDFSGIKQFLDAKRAEGVTDVGDWVLTDPHAPVLCARLARITAVNQSTLDLFEAASVEILLGNLSRLFTDEALTVFRHEIAALAQGKTRFVGESEQLTLRGKSLWTQVSVTIASGYEHSWEKVYVSVLDLSERKKTELQLKETVEALVQSNTELERFAYVASHDLQEPIRTVVSYTQLLERRLGKLLDDETREFFGFIVSGAKRMQALVRDLLTYSRVSSQGLPFTPVEMSRVIAIVRETLHVPIKESNARLLVGQMPVIMGDEIQLVELFQNLIGNAIKFRRPALPPEIRIEASKSNGDWRFSVIDNGIGIEPDYLSQIFVIFKRLHTSASYPGTGIGLAVVKRIVERHGGRIWAESTPGQGTAFHFTLSVAAGEATAEPPRRSKPGPEV